MQRNMSGFCLHTETRQTRTVLYTVYTVQHSVASAPVVTGSVSTYAGIQIIFGTVHADFIAAIFYVKF